MGFIDVVAAVRQNAVGDERTGKNLEEVAAKLEMTAARGAG